MTLTEKRTLIEEKFKEKYSFKVKNDRIVFQSDHGENFKIDTMRGKKVDDDCLIVDYLDTGDDGDGFFPSDYNDDFDKMVEDMIKEIEDV